MIRGADKCPGRSHEFFPDQRLSGFLVSVSNNYIILYILFLFMVIGKHRI